MPRRKSHQRSYEKRFKTSLMKGFLVFAMVVVSVGAYAFSTLPDVSILRNRYPTVRYEGPELPALVQLQRARPSSWVSLGEVSPISLEAIVISEDWAYYQHHGYDLNQIREAMQLDWERGKFSHGASTITQQVARNVFLSKDKNLWRKAKELYLAMQLDQRVGKKRVLEVYLNIAEWGPGIYGIRQAAQFYFQKIPSELTAKEGAFLAMLLPSPIRYSQSFRDRHLTDYANDTIRSILEKMAQAHYLTDEEKTAEFDRPLPFETLKSDPL